MKRLNYLRLINSNEEAAKILRMLLCLPLLPPAKIESGFNIIEVYAQRKNINLNRLFQYYKR